LREGLNWQEKETGMSFCTKEEVYSAFSRLNGYSSQGGKHKHFNQLMYTYVLFCFIFVIRNKNIQNLTFWQKISYLEHKILAWDMHGIGWLKTRMKGKRQQAHLCRRR
jgi:hypothetical protein